MTQVRAVNILSKTDVKRIWTRAVRQNFRVARQTPNANFSNFQITPNARTPKSAKNDAKTPKICSTKARKPSVYLFLAPQAKIFELSRLPEAKIYPFLASTSKIMEIC